MRDKLDHHEITMMLIAESDSLLECLAKIRRQVLPGVSLLKANFRAIVLIRENGGDEKFPEITPHQWKKRV